MENKHILQVNIDNNGGNGAFALVRYLYTYLSDDYIFDYYTMGNFLHNQEYEEILTSGGSAYSADLRGNKLIGHIKLPFVFLKFLRNHDYETVHIHSEVAYKQFLYAFAARKAGIKQIIIHSHSSDIDGDHKGLKVIFHKIMRNKVNQYGTDFLACSMPAAEWMFTQKTLNSEKFHIFHNGIAPEKYKFNIKVRDKVRKELEIEDTFVLGHVGSLKKVKNQSFLLELMSKLVKESRQYKLLLVGDGEDHNMLLEKAKKLGVVDNVIFLGSRTDVNELLQAMDVFVFPSFFEGIPMSLIEAQATGLPIIASDVINHDIKINENVELVSLNSALTEWVSAIKKIVASHKKEEGYKNVTSSDYNILTSAMLIKKIYG